MRLLLLALTLLASVPASAQWTRIDTNYGLTGPYLTSLVTADADALYATVLVGEIGAGTYQTFRSTDDGDTWTKIHQASGSASRALSFGIEDGQLVLGLITFEGFNVQGRIFLSDNDGATWRDVPLPTSLVTQIARKDNVYVVAGYTSHISTDGGTTWAFLDGAPFGGLDGAVRHSTGFYLKNGAGFRYRLADGSSTLVRIADGPLSVTGLWVADDTIWAKSTGGALYSSTDGVTWTEQTTAEPGQYNLGVPAPSGTPWLLTGPTPLAHFLSTDDGATATDITSNYPRSDNGSLCISTYAVTPTAVIGNANGSVNGGAACMASGAAQEGVYRYTLGPGPIARADGPDAGGLTIELAQNPARGGDRIALRQLEPGNLDVTLYDALGRRVAHTTLRAGETTVALPRAIEPGVYVVRAVSGEHMARRTLTVVR